MSTLATWDKINGALGSTNTSFGGDWGNLISDFMNGIDVGLTDPTKRPRINSLTRFKHNKLGLLDGDESHEILFSVDDIDTGPTRNIVIRRMNNPNETDYLVLENMPQEIRGKLIDVNYNTISNISNVHIAAAAGILYSKLTLTNSLVTTDLTDNIITQPKIADNSVGTAEIINANVTLDKLATDSVNSDKIVDGAIMNVDVNASADIDYSKLELNNSIIAGDITSNAVTTAKILDANITLEKLASNSVNSDKIVNDSIVDVDIGAHASTKVTITAKGQLNNQIAYKDENTWLTNTMVSSSAEIEVSKLEPGIDAYIIKTVAGVPTWAAESGGTLTDVNNVGTGVGQVFRDTASGEINLKTIKGGANVTITNNADDVTIASSGGGGIGGGEGTIGGTSLQSGDVSTDKKVFNIPHGLSTTPEGYSVHPSSIDAFGDYQVDADGTNIIVTYQSTPPTGTDNIALVWMASVGGDAATMAKGFAQKSGDSIETVFTIEHGMASTPLSVWVKESSEDALGNYRVDVDTTNIIITYPVPPNTGTNNLGFYWGAVTTSTLLAGPIGDYNLDDIGDVNAPTPADDDVLTWDNTAGEWIAAAAPGAGSGEANTASNQGSIGIGLYKQKTVADLEFYKIASANDRLSAALSGTDYLNLTINEANFDLANLGGTAAWTQVSKTGSVLNDMGNVNVPTPTDNYVLTWDNTAGEWIAAAGGSGGGSGNILGGTSTQNGDASQTVFVIPHELGVVPEGVSVEPISINALGDYTVDFDDTNITITYQIAPATGTGNLEWTWIASVGEGGGGSGEVNTNSNVGDGAGELVKTKVALDTPIKTIKAGTNITVTNNTNDVTIDSTGGGTTALAGLTDDVDIVTPLDGQVLEYSNIDSKWHNVENTATGGGGGSGEATKGFIQKSGDSTETIFNIPHDMASTPASVWVKESSIDALGVYRVDVDATNIIVTYQIPPQTGTNNLEYYWGALSSDFAGGGGATGPAVADSNLDDLANVNAPTPTDNYVLTWDNTTGQWIAAAASGGDITGGANVGTGIGVFKQDAVGVLQFKSLTNGSVVTAAANGDTNHIDLGIANTSITNTMLAGSIADSKLTQITDKAKLPADTVYTGDTQTISNKTLSSPLMDTIVPNTTLNLIPATDISTTLSWWKTDMSERLYITRRSGDIIMDIVKATAGGALRPMLFRTLDVPNSNTIVESFRIETDGGLRVGGPNAIRLPAIAGTSVTTPPPGYVAVFYNTTTSAMAIKNSSGTVSPI